MPKTGLERAIDVAVADFTELIVEAIRMMPLDELSRIRDEDLIVRPEPVEPDEPEAKADSMAETVAAKKVHPTCIYPGCEKNRFVRGRGFCGKHFRKWRKGKIADPEVFEDRQTAAELLSVKQVSALLGIPEHTIRRLHRLGELPGGSCSSPRKTRFVRMQIEEWARSPECKRVKHRRARRAWKSKTSGTR